MKKLCECPRCTILSTFMLALASVGRNQEAAEVAAEITVYDTNESTEGYETPWIAPIEDLRVN